MKRLCALAAALLVPVAMLVPPAEARTAVPSGDTCTATKSGTSYSIQVNGTASAQQVGLAFGAPGVTITNVVIPGSNGQFTTQGLPAGTSGAWVAENPLPGAPIATLTVTGTATGAFVIAAKPTVAGAWSDLVTCAAGSSAPPVSTPKATVSVNPKLVYVPSKKLWQLKVKISTAGVVGGVQLVPTHGSPTSSKPKTAKSGFQTHRVARAAGTVTLLFHATATGVQTLAKDGKATIRFQLSFTPTGGGTVTKLVSLTFRR